jgi:CHASE2 domain-containing sensor protein
MNPLVTFSSRVRQWVSGLSVRMVTRWKTTLYVYLAAIFSLLIVIDAAVLHVTANMRQAAFDVMVRYRIIVPKPDKDIVIVDINEASLASMAKEYGRWPWPRQVLGEFLEHLEEQHPKAVIFDILFSDPDVYNPDSDTYFAAAVSRTTNTFFPMLRLDEASDSLSQVTPAMIPGVVPLSEEAQAGATIGIVLPHFQSILQGGRLGLHNIYPDPDGIVREYVVYRDDYGWKVPSLPARVIRELGYHEPAARRVLLNWRGKPFSYQTVTFSSVFNDMISKVRKRPQDEFTNKIVLIGSTAPSLFDVKPTPMSRLHPGVEILATAIDNMKQGDYLRYPEGRILYPLLTLLIVWATAWAFYRNVGRGRIDPLFGASQFILLGVSYASINFTNTYINLTGPVTVGLVYFTIARIYATATSKVLETSALRASVERDGELAAFLLLIRVGEPDNAVGEGTLKKIRQRLEKSGTEPKSVEMLRGRQEGIWALFEHTLAVSWVIPAHDQAAHDRVTKDVENVTASLKAMLPGYLGPGTNAATWFVHEGRISGGKAARAGWRALFAEAQLRWHQAAAHDGGTTL